MAAIHSRAFLGPVGGDNMTRQKAETMRVAKEQQAAMTEKLRRNNLEFPKFEFLELIGKGSYGRVFKANDLLHNRVAAVKVIDVDSQDWKGNIVFKDDSVRETLHEIKVLQQLQDAKAKNINPFFEAFQIHSQLWIVNEYCPGGSVRTLMRGTGDKLEERYIIPIARELAVGLKAIHDAGIIHRDVKAANVMIHEKGYLQIIDFGVAGVLRTNNDKRSTIIGTPHWMPPELHKNAPPQGLTYGTEVDVWSYGCTLYEITTGTPPFARVPQGRMLGISQTREPPRLKIGDHSQGLCELVGSVLQALPANRPSMEKVLQDAYIENTEDSHPTASLVDLVKKYYQWEQSGGQRQSLFNPGGAQAAEFPEEWHEEEWNFSTTANFDQQFAGQIHQFLATTPIASGPTSGSTSGFAVQATPDSFDSYLLDPPLYTPLTSPGFDLAQVDPYNENLAPAINSHLQDEGVVENRIQRGGKALQRLFDQEADPYTYSFKNGSDNQEKGHYDAHHRPAPDRVKSDLPLRDVTQSSSLSRKELEVIDGNKAKVGIPNIDLANVNTIKANRKNRANGETSSTDEDEDDNYGGFKEPKRATMGWTFGNAAIIEENKEKARETKRVTKDWTFPASLDTDGSDTDSTPVFREPKRDTRAFVFPQMQPADDVPPAIPKRPALVHSATAPVTEPLRSKSGVIDLDALMMDSTVPDEQELMSAAFNVQDSTTTVPAASRDTEPPFSSTDPALENAPEQTVTYSASSTDDESENTNFNLFTWQELTDDEIQAAIDRELTAHGILDPMVRGIKRRDILKKHKEAQMWVKADIEESGSEAGYEAWRNRGSRNFSDFEDFPNRDDTLWSKFDPQVTQAPSWPRDYGFGQKKPSSTLAEILRNIDACSHSPTHNPSPTNRENKARDIDAELRALGYPDAVPPSAAAMAQDAPDELLVGEATRLLRDMMQGLEVGKKVIRAVREQMRDENADAESDAGRRERSYGGSALRYEEGSDAGAESD